MSDYIFWPNELLRKESSFENEELIIIAIKLEETDYVVIAIEQSSILQDTLNLEYPYTILGNRDNQGNWTINIPHFTIVEFEVPKFKMMQFYSIEPISLILPKNNTVDNPILKKIPNIEKLISYERYKARNYKLNKTIDIINTYNSTLNAFHHSYPMIGKSKENNSSGIISLQRWYTSTVIHKLTCYITFYITFCACYIAYFGSHFLRKIVPTLLRLSATAKQIDLRFQQICYFPVQYMKINQTKPQGRTTSEYRRLNDESSTKKIEPSCKFYPDYIRFYNTLWLIVNDTSFGLMLGAVLHDNHDVIVNTLSDVIMTTLYEKMIEVTYSLANNPFGIKLNHELASFLSELFYWIMEFSYNSLIKFASDKEKLSIFLTFVTNISCIFGASFGISLIVDFFSLLSFHIYLFYHISCKLYHWQLNTLISLFYLFCGKKRNVLRKRIDYDYFEIDELLLGTLLFIVLSFLMPTVLSFYASYTLVWMTAVYISVFLNSAIGLINHFPLFAFLLRIKDPKRLPGGILLLPKYHKNGRVILKLHNNPLSVPAMFNPFSHSLGKIKEYYFSTVTFKNMLSGTSIKVQFNELYDILYLSLPEEPIDISQILSKLKERLPR
ncbi:similar to Saccharomyces cerevisiae YGR216C GPI1 Membrane protein involved in the synthesis of N-acetylglucosaminyl phosphatidylinositol (GlcNAc-PI) [Maudiozyma saulgeensis]|uniref:Similar to Saccharomyces cerevisiae YGR216C GPI1 Membrane protein involved in the synthesis of N-acetylglucosaminyl phosphatidylinositol (GlcNAc-PI) n=1 Tax=Maudiozyma saulgeensis TaxID=1789683 RepID=A0A1X7R9N5_9SACH|nr:similar to Saccharomyces cerevisiae YGR216C GPI1 Membrane protein involved in the synthesis of N-acetylglucosaminyl phosphatidylinositol (GlcNAc-PI) [Kazachstania saulgeensis]